MLRIFFGGLIFVLFGDLANDSSCSSTKEKDYIIWKEGIKLKWSDFRKNEFAGLGVGATSAIRMKLDYEIDNSVKFFRVECLFLRNESNSRYDRTDYALKHEQSHFDLSEVYARQLRKRLLEVRSSINRSNYLQLDSIYRVYNQADIDMQIVYDKETDHAYDTLQQKVWDIKIQKQLDSLSNFSKHKYQ
jgi:hypothetical protein